MLACFRTKRKREPIKTLRDGRQVCDLKTASGLREYKRRTEFMWLRQEGICSICIEPLRLDEATFEHDDGRGHGGGHRDDRTEINGEPYNHAVHGFCNVRKASVRLANYERKSA
jgi:hypothetical protein